MILFVAFILLAGFFYGWQWHLAFYSPKWAFTGIPAPSPGWRDYKLVPFWMNEWWAYTSSQYNKYADRREEEGPAFLWATWILVFLTDAFHFMQAIGHIFLFLGIGQFGFLLAACNGIDTPTIIAFSFSGAGIAWLLYKTGFTIALRLMDYMSEKRLLNAPLRALAKLAGWVQHTTLGRFSFFGMSIATLAISVWALDSHFDKLLGTDHHPGYYVALLVFGSFIIFAFYKVVGYFTRGDNKK